MMASSMFPANSFGLRALKDKNPIPLNFLPQRRARYRFPHQIDPLANNSGNLALDGGQVPKIQPNVGREFGRKVNVAGLGRLVARHRSKHPPVEARARGDAAAGEDRRGTSCRQASISRPRLQF